MIDDIDSLNGLYNLSVSQLKTGQIIIRNVHIVVALFVVVILKCFYQAVQNFKVTTRVKHYFIGILLMNLSYNENSDKILSLNSAVSHDVAFLH